MKIAQCDAVIEYPGRYGWNRYQCENAYGHDGAHSSHFRNGKPITWEAS